MKKIKQPKNHQTLTLKAAIKVPMPPILKDGQTNIKQNHDSFAFHYYGKQKTGLLEVTLFSYKIFTLVPLCLGRLSRTRCATREVANSKYFSSINTDTLISEVEIIWMLMPSSAKVRNMVEATPTCERMPTPTIDTLHTVLSPSTICAPMFWTSFKMFKVRC